MTERIVSATPVRWCPFCGTPATLTEEEWREIERMPLVDKPLVVCGYEDCLRAPHVWLTTPRGEA